MDKIVMKNLSFYGYHGVSPEENTLGQKFFVNVILCLDLKSAGVYDRLEDTVNYAKAYEIIRESVETKKFKLIEALAEDIAQNILNQFPIIEKINVEVRKPEAPVKGIFDYFGVEIKRVRHE